MTAFKFPVFRVAALVFVVALIVGNIYIPEVMGIISHWSAIAFGIIVVLGLICFFCWPIQIRPSIRNKIYTAHPTGNIKDMDVAIDASGEIHLVWTAKDKRVYEGVYDVYYQAAPHIGAEWSEPERLGLGHKAYLQVTNDVLNVIALDKKRVAIYRSDKKEKSWRHIGSFLEDHYQQDHALVFDEETGFLNLVLVYTLPNEGRSVFFTRSGDLGNSWTDLLLVAKGIPRISGRYISCSASGDAITILWQDEGEPNGPVVGYSQKKGGEKIVHRRKEVVVKGMESNDGGQSWSEILPLVTNIWVGHISLVHASEGLCMLAGTSPYPYKLLCWVYKKDGFEIKRSVGRFASGLSISEKGDLIAYITSKYHRRTPFEFVKDTATKGLGKMHNDLMLVSLKGKGGRLITPRQTIAYGEHPTGRRLVIRKIGNTAYVFWNGRKNVTSRSLEEGEVPEIFYTSVKV
ncbi:MAG: hypothetical protein KTR29_17770 [Rhodothermaceae bacterium]|nr:hypothetical protein [Rhodothermaceae bacterium]